MLDFDFIHPGPETLAGYRMRMFWQPVYRSDDVKAGRAVRPRIMNEDFALYRGWTGAPFVIEGPAYLVTTTAMAEPQL
jgi:hypothetical protein